MPSWLELLDQLNRAYQPGQREDGPNVGPGYWAANALRSGNPLEVAGILPGILGSALQGYTENVPDRIGAAIMGRSPESYREHLATYNPLAQAATRFATDPLSPFSFGLKTAGTVGKALLGAKIGEPVGQAIARGVNYPFEKTAEGAGQLVKGAGALIRKTDTGKKLFAESAASQARGVTTTLEDLANNTLEILKYHTTPLAQMTVDPMPIFMRGKHAGKPDKRAISAAIAGEWEAMENASRNVIDPNTALYNMNIQRAASAARNDINQTFSEGLMARLDSPDEDEVATAIATAEAMWVRNKNLLASAHTAVQKGGEFTQKWSGKAVPGGATIPPMTRLQQLQDEAMATKQRMIKDTGAEVASLYKQPRTPQTSAQVSELYNLRNRGMIGVMDDLAEQIQKEFAIPQDVADDIAKTAGEDFIGLLSSLELANVGGPGGINAMIPTSKKAILDQASSLWYPEIHKIVAAQHAVAKHLGKVLGIEVGAPGQVYDMQRLVGMVNDQLTVLNQPALPPLGQLTSPQLTEAVAQLARGGVVKDLTEVNKLTNVLGKWAERGDLLVGDPLQMSLAATATKLEAAFKGGMTQKASNPVWDTVTRWYNTTNALQKDNLLANFGYLWKNAFSGYGFNKFLGNPGDASESTRIAAHQLRATRAAIKRPGSVAEADLFPPEFAYDLVSRGKLRARSNVTTGGFISSLFQAAGSKPTATARVGKSGRFVYSVLTAPVDPVAGVAEVAAWTLGGDKIVRYIKDLARITENSLRLAPYRSEWNKQLTAAMPKFIDEVGETLKNNQRYIPSVHTPLTQAINRPPIGEITQWIVSKDTHFSPKEFMSMLSDKGVHIDDVKTLGQRWTDLVDETESMGEEFANSIHVNYAKTTNIEEAIDKVFPFVRWPIRMVPNFQKVLAQNPAFVIAITRLNSITTEDAKRSGLPKKYQKMIDTGSFGSYLANRIFHQGEGGKLYVDASGILMPWESYTSGAGDAQFAQGPVEAAVDMFPFEPFATVKAPAQIASSAIGSAIPGLKPMLPYSAETPLSPVNRFSGLAGLLGGNPQELWTKLAEMIPGVQNYDFRRADIQKRLGEMAGRDTGFVDHPSYMAARGTESGPLYEQAGLDIGYQRGTEQGLGMVWPVGLKYVRPEELATREAAKNLPVGRRDTPEKIAEFSRALAQNPQAAAHQGVQGTELRTKLQYVFQVMRNPALLFPDAKPEVAARLAQQLNQYERLEGNEKAQRALTKSNPQVGAALIKKNQFLNTNPEAAAYMNWRSQVHPQERAVGEQALSDSFIGWYLSGRNRQRYNP